MSEPRAGAGQAGAGRRDPALRSGAAANRWLATATAALLVLLTFASILSAQRDHGIVRDEVVYFGAADSYARWWGKLLSFEDGMVSEERITAHFGGKSATANNREHPPLMKTLFGAAKWMFADTLGWTTEVTAYRLPTALMAALLVVLVFAFTLSVWGYAEALIAALVILAMPRLFFHAGLATFDAPVVTLWLATVYCYWRALASRPWCIALGVSFGLLLATKHNAIIIPACLVAHYLWIAAARAGVVRTPGLGAKLRAWGRGLRDTRPLALVSLVVIGPLVLVAVWPWLWFDTITHVRQWIGFHLAHVHYNFEYLGDNWNHPPFPWHVALVTTLFTVPVATLAAGFFGAGVLLRCALRGDSADPDRAPALLLFLSAGAAMGPFLLGSTPIFGAEKHWAPAMPTIAIFAGVGAVVAGRMAARGLASVWPRARGALGQSLAIGAVGAMVVGAATAATVDAQPYALSHYNALAGGAPGGADLGMNRQFWGYAARGVLPYLAEQEPGRVYTHDASPAWGWYRKLDLLPPGFGDAGHELGGIRRSQYALVVHELHFNRHDYLIWDVYDTTRPVFVLRTDGVPIVSVYARRSAGRD